MGIARISYAESKNVNNNIALRFRNGKIEDVWLDCKIFPLYCKYCEQTHTELFLHMSSRYGQVGPIPCEFCNRDITVVDSDTYVDGIEVSGEPCSFQQLYLLSADYIGWFEEWYGITLASESLFESWTDWMSVDQLREQIETLTGIETDSQARYQTDEKFNPLPSFHFPSLI